MTLKFILNKYGNKELLVDGFSYTRQYNGEKEITWRCKSYESHGCAAKAYTTNDSRTGSLRLCGTHVHPGDPVGIAKQKVLSKLCSRAQKSSDNTKSNVPSPVAAASPRVESMRRQVQRVRHDVRPYLATPKSVDELILPDEFTCTWKGDEFLLYDSGGKNRILIFTTDKNLNYLASCPVILCDGTFYSVPRIFAQLYTFHGLNESGKTLPVVYVSMSNRRLASYVKVLNVLSQLKPGIKPVKILIDFENAFVKAVHKVFPDSIVCGCNFHFNECGWRNVQCNGLSILYTNDINYSTGIRMLAAFKSTWLGVKSTRGHRKSLFEHIMWNCYDRVICNQPRTTNAVEGWHNSFNKLVSRAHPTIGEFINCMKDEQANTELTLAQMNVQRVVVPHKRRRYVENDNRLKKIVESYKKDNIICYLRAVALNLKM